MERLRILLESKKNFKIIRLWDYIYLNFFKKTKTKDWLLVTKMTSSKSFEIA